MCYLNFFSARDTTGKLSQEVIFWEEIWMKYSMLICGDVKIALKLNTAGIVTLVLTEDPIFFTVQFCNIIAFLFTSPFTFITLSLPRLAVHRYKISHPGVHLGTIVAIHLAVHLDNMIAFHILFKILWSVSLVTVHEQSEIINTDIIADDQF